MPIYEYRCSECGFEQEYLRKVSDAPLTECPQCKQPTFQKKLTAAGFQLKGTGWYATDFRDSGKAGKSKQGEKSASDKPDSASSSATEKTSSESNSAGDSKSSSDSKSSTETKSSGSSSDKSAAA